jgi:hypothetical protein
MLENGIRNFKSSRDIEKMSRSAEVGVAKVGCSRNDKTKRGKGKRTFLIHSGFDLKSSRSYVRYLQHPFCDHVLYIYKVNYFSNFCTLIVVAI